jgi:Dockerin type I domain
VTSVDTTTATFKIGLSGTDSGGSGVAWISLFVQVDHGAPTLVAKVAAGTTSVSYNALVDGEMHTYRFFSQGVDAAGNVEVGSAGLTVQKAVSPPPVVGLVLQGGQAERSYVSTVDLNFGSADGLDSIVAGGHVHLVKYSRNGKSMRTVPLAGVLHVVDHAIELDFGAAGLGGNPAPTAGDGSYKLTIDGMSKPFTFERLLGDVNGDGVVNRADFSLIRKSIGTKGVALRGDVNGDGVVNSTDLVLAKRSKGHRVSHPRQGAKR